MSARRVALFGMGAALLAIGLYFVVRQRPASPFTVAAPWTFYAYDDSRRAAAFFLALPRSRQTFPVNATAFVRVDNHSSEPLWIDGLTGVIHRIDGSWTTLRPIDVRRLGAAAYYSSARYGIGWPLAEGAVLTLAGHDPIPPHGDLSGFVFFGYPVKRYAAGVDGLSILVRARGGETELGQNGTIWVRDNPFPSRKVPPANLRTYRFRYYCSIAGLC